MENRIDIVKYFSTDKIADTIKVFAFENKCINSTTIGKDCLKYWKQAEQDLCNSLIEYGTLIQEHSNICANCTNETTIANRWFDGHTQIYDVELSSAKTKFYNALQFLRDLGKFTFPNGIGKDDELNLWFASLTTFDRQKDENGKITSFSLDVKFTDGTRKKIELMLAMRETGKIGMTMKEYNEYKKQQKELKKKARQEKEKEKAKITGVEKMSPDCYENAIA